METMDVTEVIKDPPVQKALNRLERMVDAVIDEARHICVIPAPSFEEEERAHYVLGRMRQTGLKDIHLDEDGNVVGILEGGKGAGATLLITAHMDTVFERSIPLTTYREGDYLYGPGVGDNSLGVASLLCLAQCLASPVEPWPGRIIFAANMGETGTGNLRGIRGLVKRHGDEVDYAIVIEGATQSVVCVESQYSRRLEITYRGVGSYSWGGFGNPSAIHSLGKCIHAITEIQVPSKPKTTYNVGKVAGGLAVNVVAPEAGMILDLRSEELAALDRLEQDIRDRATQIAEADGSGVTVRLVGEHPYGKLAEDHPLRDIIAKVQAGLDIKSDFVRGSSDVAAPLAAGIPSACLGVTTGTSVGLPAERIDICPITPGLKQLYLVIHLLQQGR